MPQHTITVTDEEYKALAWDIVDPVAWIDNLVHDKARRCADAIITLALDDLTHTILTAAEKELLVDALQAQGIIINTVKSLPDTIKAEIVKRARIKTAAERQLEIEAVNA